MPRAEPERLTHEERAQRRAEIAEHIRAGTLTPEQAASKYGLTLPTVKEAMREHGVRSPTSNELGPNTYRIIALLLGSTPPSEIAERVGLSHSRVFEIRDKCVEAGIKFPKPHKPKRTR